MFPPGPDTIGSKLRGVVVDSHADPTTVVRQIVDPIRNGLAQLLVQKIVHPSLLRFPLRLPFPSGIFKVAHQFLFLGVHRYDRLTPAMKPLGQRVDVFKLGISVRMLRPLKGFGIGLKAVVELVQQVGHLAVSDTVALSLKLLRQATRAFAGPAQQRFWIPPRRWLHQGIQRLQDIRRMISQWLAPPPGCRIRPTDFDTTRLVPRSFAPA